MTDAQVDRICKTIEDCTAAVLKKLEEVSEQPPLMECVHPEDRVDESFSTMGSPKWFCKDCGFAFGFTDEELAVLNKGQ